MKKDILIVANYAPIPQRIGNNRLYAIIDLLLKESFAVEMIGSTFSHSKKKQMDIDDKVIKELPYKYTMVYEPGYPKNVSLKRFIAIM